MTDEQKQELDPKTASVQEAKNIRTLARLLKQHNPEITKEQAHNWLVRCAHKIPLFKAPNIVLSLQRFQLAWDRADKTDDPAMREVLILSHDKIIAELHIPIAEPITELQISGIGNWRLTVLDDHQKGWVKK